MKRRILFGGLVLFVVFLGWRFLRPMNIFIVEDKIAWGVDTSDAPALFGNLSAKVCGSCHKKIYSEWRTTIHSRAWTDPYFQADLKFDSNQFICRLCHTPLDRQLPSIIVGYHDKNKWQPILKPNPKFDRALQHEGITCAVCHLRKGKILGVLGDTDAPHPVRKLDNPNRVCMRCHLVKSESFGVYVRFPPCGTVAEILSSKNRGTSQRSVPAGVRGSTGEMTVSDIASLRCVNCHMPLVRRALVEGGRIRKVRRHLWRGGHDPQMVRKALTIRFSRDADSDGRFAFTLMLLNSGASHYVPTGTPDRHFSVKFSAFDETGKLLSQRTEILRRNFIWRPFIIDIGDTRLRPGVPRTYRFSIARSRKPRKVVVAIRYHLLDEKRRRRIGYQNEEPISYEIFRKEFSL